jgi:serine/threonine-protein kinase RIO1
MLVDRPRVGFYPLFINVVAGSLIRHRTDRTAWKNAEVDALYKLVAAGVRVPKRYGYFRKWSWLSVGLVHGDLSELNVRRQRNRNSTAMASAAGAV